jgi:hypothetical protein
MGFKIAPTIQPFKATISIAVPGGEPEPLNVTVRYKNRTDAADWMTRMGAIKTADEEVKTLMEVYADAELEGEDGQPAPFNSESLKAMLDARVGAGGDMVREYLAALAGARAKN